MTTTSRFPAVRVNITIQARVLRRIDEHARRLGVSRSALLAKAALEAMAKEKGRG